MSLIRGDARHLPLVDRCVQCVVTSPPYWGLRDYGIAGQLGLEPTPDAYVAAMVDVFREVWRVLKDDGTLWLNLGDSYAGSFGAQSRDAEGAAPLSRKQASGRSPQVWGTGRPVHAKVDGLKPKDLCGIPWRVAFALQQPYYAGSIRSREDRIWLAAMLDAEGCMFIHKRKAGQNNGQGYQRQNDNYGPGVEISNTSLALVERIAAIVGKGSICSQGPEENGRRKQRIYRWNLRTTESREFVRELYPYLVAKQQQARILCGCPSSGERAEAAHAALIALHRTGESDVDFPAPTSMFTPGWYLRSDIIWAKNNPMPESVTDRPTKAHEYLFLLAKSERYYYNAAAIREASIYPDDNRKARARREDYEDRAVNDRISTINPLNARVYPERNKRSVWTVNTKPYSDAHFATFPPALVEPCILAGSRVGDLVLDPFIGSGTVGAVCDRLMRRWVGVDLTYQQLSKKRTRQRGLRLEEASA